MKILRILKKILFNMIILEKGTVDFSTGDHEIFIKTGHKHHKHHREHQKVWIHTDHQYDPSCSYLDGDMFAVYDILPNGFIIKAHVESNSRKLHWFTE